MKLVLASASPRRAEIMHDAGFSFVIMSSAVDESTANTTNPSSFE
jgi:predicted house-cleaning NTP pyrophosphatase (Maf/HAM1 superfamily)